MEIPQLTTTHSDATKFASNDGDETNNIQTLSPDSLNESSEIVKKRLCTSTSTNSQTSIEVHSDITEAGEESETWFHNQSAK